ncbi:arylsulfatase A-like enzyme [Dysgonomonas alginatilytica]|uniref:Arylsulfatase A-like enzyme n=1 Tax=Dysgonomonas alginatilytica TaxID=1605892 RepID=A0A2V3PSY1_9BACT|nr:sulfatase-like hydrolase/transferase [Dysgonomonas alginatilytica]PXV65883.1 arylsulfatase A-like enzyme [Dysgonomonas alginatilytica]
MKKHFYKVTKILSPLFGCLLPASVLALDTYKPNIIFILADDLGYGDLGCYGNKIIKTPHIDNLANEGLKFTDCYAGASVSSPSRCSLMTGLHTGHSRIRGNMCREGGIEGTREGMAGTVRRTNLQPQDSTIANVLSNNGYVTCLVNKWHLDGFDPNAGPLDRGFQEFYGWLIREPQSHNFYPTIRYRNRQEYVIEDNLNDKKIDHNTDRATIEAIDFIQRNQQKPFFLYLAYNAPHVPLDAKSWGDYKNMDLSDNDKSYAALVTHMDECIGKVLSELKKLDLDKNTIVVFASDNGGAKAANTEKLILNGGLRGWKGDLYEGGIRVPLIIKMPDGINVGKSSEFPCYFPDFLATFSDMTDSYTTLKTDGMSLLPEIKKPNSLSDEERFLYWEQFPSKGISQAVRWGDWKLIRQNIGKEYELYNIKTDRAETRDVATQFPDITNRLAEYMRSAHVESENWPVN